MYYDPCFQSECFQAKNLEVYTNFTILTSFQPYKLSPKHHCPEICQCTQTCKMIDRQRGASRFFWVSCVGSDLLRFFFSVKETGVISQDYLIYFSDICQVAGSFYACYTAALNTESQGH